MPPKRKREAEPADDIERFDVDARFSTAIAYGPLVFITGQVGEGASAAEQTKNALASVDDALALAGTSKDRILEATVWLADIDRDYAAMNKVYDRWVAKGKAPTRACVQAKLAYPELLVEFRVTAARAPPPS